MGANIIQFLETTSLNSLACIEHTDRAKTSTSTGFSWIFMGANIIQLLAIIYLNSLVLSNVWAAHVDLCLSFELAD